MTMPSDAADAVETAGSNEGPRDHDGVDTEHAAYVDEDNVPHPGDANRPADRGRVNLGLNSIPRQAD